MRGSIIRRGKAWLLKFDKATADGKRKFHYTTVRGSRQDAERELTRLLAEADKGALPDVTKASLGSYLDDWLGSAHTQSLKTRERYDELARCQIVPHLGGIGLQKLRPEHLQRWHKALIEGGLSARTVTNAHKLLHRVLADATKNGTVSRNVAEIRKPPKVEAAETEILAPKAIPAVLAALENHSLFPIVSLALATGMRRGELLALQWGDLDLDRGVLRVERSLEETKAGLRFKPPKTKRGRRNIALPPDAVTMLRAHRSNSSKLVSLSGSARSSLQPLCSVTWKGGRSSRIPSAAHGSALLSPRGCRRSRSTR